ncbi:MAG: cytochrome c [Xanthobacteraceae bacterium]
MMRAMIRAAFVAALLPASGVVAQPSEKQLAAQGKIILTKQCSRCHQVGMIGRSPLAIAPSFRAIMQQYAPEDLEEALAEGLTSGHPAMPEFEFEPDEIAAILAYLGTLREKR